MKRKFYIIAIALIIPMGNAFGQQTKSNESTRTVELQVTGMEVAWQASDLDKYMTDLNGIVSCTTDFRHMQSTVVFRENDITIANLIQTMSDKGYAVRMKRKENPSLTGGNYRDDGTLKQ